MIYVIGIGIAFFLSLLLLGKKDKTKADRILTCWLIFMGAHLLLFYLYFSGTAFEFPWLLGVGIPLPLVHGPFLFLYTVALTSGKGMTAKIALLHFIPAVAVFAYLVPFYLSTPEHKSYVFRHNGAGYEQFLSILEISIILSGVIYTVASSLILSRHRRRIEDEFSNTEKINLRWLQMLIYGIAVIWLLQFAGDEVLFAGVVIFVLLIGYFGIRQVGILSNYAGKAVPARLDVESETDAAAHRMQTITNASETFTMRATDTYETGSTHAVSALIEGSQKKKYSRSGLNPEVASQLHEKLKVLMKEEKLYQDPELSLATLAEKLDTLPNYLSQLINEREEKNFYDYINSLRIGEFKRLLAIPGNEKYTLVSLSYDCGFNSKSSFNKNFKKVTGKSPSEYLESLSVNP